MDKVPSPTEDLIEELKDPEFKKDYGAEQAKLEFAVVLHDARTQARLTQQQLAGLLGRSQPYVARLEGGEANPTLAAVGRMLAALDLRIVIKTTPIKPELGTPVVVLSAAGVIQDVMLTNASNYVVCATEMSLHVAQNWIPDLTCMSGWAQNWISVPGRPTSNKVRPATTGSPVAVGATVLEGA